jgi:hypothetical protein
MPATDPSPRGLEVQRICRRIVRQEVAAAEQIIDRTTEALTSSPSSDSGKGRLYAWLDDQLAGGANPQHVQAWAIIADELPVDVIKLGGSLADHVRAYSVLLDSDPPFQSAMLTTSRAIIEAVLQIAWLLDPLAAPQTHILRAAAGRLESIEGSARTSAHLAASPKEQEISGAVTGIQDWLADAGFERQVDGRYPRYSVNLGLNGERINVRWNVADAARLYMPGSAYVWPIFSGAAHSRGWFNNSAYAMPDDDTEDITTFDDTQAATVLSLLTASDAFVDALYGWTGLDPLPAHRKTHFRRRALLHAWGEVFHAATWEEYKANSVAGQRATDRRAADRGRRQS